MLALTLQEKGSASLRNRAYAEALGFLLRAEQTYAQCSARVLELVDNQALVYLDIVYCQFKLGDIGAVHDAAGRLERCEAALRRSYGAAMSRASSVRRTDGGSPPEMAVLARLYVMQAVVAYHLADEDAARRHLNAAADVLRALRVDDAAVAQLCELGFSVCRAKLALRACGGSVERAAAYIADAVLQEEENRRLRISARNRRRRAAQLGTTTSGRPVAPDLVDALISMGFDAQRAARALRRADNDLEQAAQLLTRSDADTVLWQDADASPDTAAAESSASLDAHGAIAAAEARRRRREEEEAEAEEDERLVEEELLPALRAPSGREHDIADQHLDVDIRDLNAILAEYQAKLAR